ncbi:MAG: hotdog fold domain-containing protein [Polyangiaceae bacterium]
MALSSTLSQFLPSSISTSSRNIVRDQWDLLSKLPGGRFLFSKAIGKAAPYTGSIDARVEELRQGYARVSLTDRHAVRNHLDCVHAIALVNLAEVAGNLALAYSLPDDARFIVAGLSIEYLKKARGTIIATSTPPLAATSARQEYEVPVSMTNQQGEEVARATLRTLVGPKKSK